MTRALLTTLFSLFLLSQPTATGALELCVKADFRGPDPTAPTNNSPIKLRKECRLGKEVSLGTTEDLAKIQANEAAIATNAGDIATESARRPRSSSRS